MATAAERMGALEREEKESGEPADRARPERGDLLYETLLGRGRLLLLTCIHLENA